MNYVVDPVEFESWWKDLVFTLSSTFTALMLYALYVVLFIFSIHTLTHRNRPGSRFLLVTTSVMFFLGTSEALVSVVQAGIMIRLNKKLIQGSPDFPRLSRLYYRVALFANICLAVNDLVADLVFLYRCYVIWGSRKTVLILPGLSIFATLVVGCISAIGYDIKPSTHIDDRLPYIMGAGTNVILVCLTAGRIWYVRRQAHIINDNTFRKRYDTAISMILESGGIYCLVVILEVITQSLNVSSKSVSIFGGVIDGLVSQANIVPTLILVRVGMGHFQWKQDPSPFNAPLPSERTSRRRVPAISMPDSSSTVIELK